MDMHTQIDSLMQEKGPHVGKIETLQDDGTDVVDTKDALVDVLQLKFAKFESDMKALQGIMNQLIFQARQTSIKIQMNHDKVSFLSLCRFEGQVP